MGDRFSGTDFSEFHVGGDRLDDLFEAMSHPRRRFALQYIHESDTPCSVEELTTEMVAWEARQPVAERSGADRGDIEVALVHNHLPKLADAGFVDYDHADRRVAAADRTDEVRAPLRAVSDD